MVELNKKRKIPEKNDCKLYIQEVHTSQSWAWIFVLIYLWIRTFTFKRKESTLSFENLARSGDSYIFQSENGRVSDFNPSFHVSTSYKEVLALIFNMATTIRIVASIIEKRWRYNCFNLVPPYENFVLALKIQYSICCHYQQRPTLKINN